jgi:diacylglycerol kinase (ATP)
MGKTGITGIKRVINAFGYSMRGLRDALRYEAAFRQEVALFCILLPVAIWLGKAPIDYIVLIGSLLLVLIVEILNSAIEAVVDRVGAEHHDLSGRAKDMGSAAVLIAVVNVVFIWAMIVYQRFFS